jgi:hypothetical protein
MRLGLFQNDGMTFLQNFVDGNESLEGLDFVGHDGLTGATTQYGCDNFGRYYCLHLHAGPEGLRTAMVVGVDNACSDVFPWIWL